MHLILTSVIDCYDKDEKGNKISKRFGNKNQILDSIEKYVKRYENFLFVASVEDNAQATDIYATAIFKSFDLTLPFQNYHMLDGRTEGIADRLIREADLIFLCGGHLPTQNRFFQKINLREKIKNTQALIIGASAGAMNMANDVYVIPELEGESMDLDFRRSAPGLGLTNINILPHYDAFLDTILDGRRFIEEIVLPDTNKRTVYGLNNGSYILVDKKAVVYGEAYLLENGTVHKICGNEESVVLKEK